MSKPVAGRKVGEREALAVATTVRGSPYKLNLVAGLIVVRDNLPVGPLLDLQAQHSIDGRLNQRLDCRGYAQLALALGHA